MATIREIRRRIGAVTSTRKITRAMQLVAAAKLRRAQENLLKLRPYADRMERLTARVAARVSGDSHLLLCGRGSTSRRLLVVVTGDSGLSGGFNANVIRAARAYLDDCSDDGGADIFCVGRKGRDFFRRANADVIAEKTNFFGHLRYPDAVEVAKKIVALYLEHGYERVDVLYNGFRSAIRQDLGVKTLLPFTSPEDAGGAPSPDYLCEPGEQAVLDRLIPYSIEVRVWRVMLESCAAEMGAKMTAMDAATENANKLLASLSVSYNRARQAQITREITEIVGGAEALG